MLAKLGYGMVARVKGLPQIGSLESGFPVTNSIHSAPKE
jgi:hypothetical protein